ncbi:MAG: cupredoxin domain-containing protein [Acidothermaceae bacterium]
MTSPTPTGAAAPSGTAANAASGVIVIKNFAYMVPASVAPSATVTVKNEDAIVHTVTADGGEFDDQATASSSTTFTAPAKPGSYPFHCKYHGNMHGVLVVK